MRYYFASKKNVDNEVLSPRVPLHRTLTEDNETKRICVSQSINGCLTAVDNFVPGKIVYIHVCECDDEYIVQPELDQVIDACFTGELWITEDVKMTLFMTIKITGMITTRIANMNNTMYSFSTVGGGDSLFHQEVGYANFNKVSKYEEKLAKAKETDKLQEELEAMLKKLEKETDELQDELEKETDKLQDEIEAMLKKLEPDCDAH